MFIFTQQRIKARLAFSWTYKHPALTAFNYFPISSIFTKRVNFRRQKNSLILWQLSKIVSRNNYIIKCFKLSLLYETSYKVAKCGRFKQKQSTWINVIYVYYVYVKKSTAFVPPFACFKCSNTHIWYWKSTMNDLTYFGDEIANFEISTEMQKVINQN